MGREAKPKGRTEKTLTDCNDGGQVGEIFSGEEKVVGREKKHDRDDADRRGDSRQSSDTKERKETKTKASFRN